VSLGCCCRAPHRLCSSQKPTSAFHTPCTHVDRGARYTMAMLQGPCHYPTIQWECHRQGTWCPLGDCTCVLSPRKRSNGRTRFIRFPLVASKLNARSLWCCSRAECTRVARAANQGNQVAFEKQLYSPPSVRGERGVGRERLKRPRQ
jgi:hypothetical protein